MKRFAAAVFAGICFLCLSFGVCGAAAHLSVQITMYDLERDPGQPAAVGRGPLTASEQKAKLTVFSTDPELSGRSYDRDVFYLVRTGYEPGTGAVRFRVRHEQIIENRCTAMEIREYTMKVGESCELYSDRGQVRAVMKFV